MKFQYKPGVKIGVSALMLVSGFAVAMSGSVASASSKSKGPNYSKDVYNIASIIPLSTAAAAYGIVAEELDNLALANIKKNHTIQGTIRNWYYDSQALPAPAVAAAQQAVSIHHVLGMQVLFTSPVSAVVPIATSSKTIEINPGATGPSLYNLSPYLLSVVPLGTQQVNTYAPFAVKTEGYTKWVVLYTAEPLGQGLDAAIDTAVPNVGGRVVADIQISPTATDFSAQVAQIAAAVGPSSKNTLVYLATSGNVSGNNQKIMDELVAAGVNVEYAGFTNSVTAALQADPNAGSYQYTSSFVNLKDNNVVTKQFIQSVTAHYPDQVSNLEANMSVYNSFLLIADTIHHLQAKKLKVTNANLIKAMHSEGAVQVAGGAWTVQNTGTVNAAVEIQQLHSDGSSTTIFGGSATPAG